MNAQQAPSCCSRQRPPSGALHTAFTVAQAITGGISHSASAVSASVTAALAGEENRLARIQASGPLVSSGAGRSRSGMVRTKARLTTSALPQREAGVVQVERRRQ